MAGRMHLLDGDTAATVCEMPTVSAGEDISSFPHTRDDGTGMGLVSYPPFVSSESPCLQKGPLITNSTNVQPSQKRVKQIVPKFSPT